MTTWGREDMELRGGGVEVIRHSQQAFMNPLASTSDNAGHSSFIASQRRTVGNSRKDGMTPAKAPIMGKPNLMTRIQKIASVEKFLTKSKSMENRLLNILAAITS